MCNTVTTYLVSNALSKDLEEKLTAAAKLIFEGKLLPEDLDADLVKAIALELTGAIDFLMETSPDLARRLAGNIYVFSGFKTYQELQEASILMVGEGGKLKGFNEYLKDVKTLNQTYNVAYLEAEYNTATANAQMANQWESFVANADVAPWLRYETALDERVREEHAILHGTTLRIDDPFWDTYFPPNGWNCRCDITQLTDGEETKVDKLALPELGESFRFNPGKDKVVFPSTHPYFDVSQAERGKVMESLTRISKEI